MDADERDIPVHWPSPTTQCISEDHLMNIMAMRPIGADLHTGSEPMWWKALLVWLLFMVGVIANGTLRRYMISPLLGPTWGHVLSTVLLCIGHSISRISCWQMLGVQDLLKCRVWVFVPLVTMLAPWWMSKLRGLLP